MDKRELQLINEAAKGCDKSILELTEKYKETYYKLRNSFKNSMSNNLFDAESFLAYPEWFVYKTAKTFNAKKGASFNTWLTITIRGHFLDMLKVKRNKSLSIDEDEDIYNKKQYTSRQIHTQDNFFDKIKQCLDPKLYEAIYYRYECGYKTKEAAEVTKCHHETFRHRHNKALNILRDSLSHDSIIWA